MENGNINGDDEKDDQLDNCVQINDVNNVDNNGDDHHRVNCKSESGDDTIDAGENNNNRRSLTTTTTTERTDICRDFTKNICNRGSRCKYYHPPDIQHEQYQDDIKFCIDYQNRGCSRENCRYVHAHRDDADRYKRIGEVTLGLARAIADSVNGIPFCKEFQTGSCSRGANRCRYWHINPNEERERRRMEFYSHQRVGASNNGDYDASPPVRATAPPIIAGSGQHRRESSSLLPAPNSRDYYYQQHQMPPHSRNSYDYDAVYGDDGGIKRARYDSDMMTTNPRYVHDLERKNSDLCKENDQLKRELGRERQRYEDLYALFRQQTQHQPATQPVVTAQLQSSNAAGPSVGYPAYIASTSAPSSAAELVSLASQTVAIHQSRSAATVISSSGQQQQPQQYPGTTTTTDVAVHWSVAGVPHVHTHWST